MFRQLYRYFLSGGLAFVVDAGTLWLLTVKFGVYYQIGVAVGYLLGLIITYLMATLWIFDEHRTDNKIVEFMIFAAIGAVGMALTQGIMWLMVDVAGMNVMIGKIFTTGVVTIFNFFAKKIILFTRGGKQ